MTAFPDLLTGVSPKNPLEEIIQYKTLISEFESGDPQRKQKWTYPRRRYRLRYQYISKANARTLWQFFMARSGRYGEFNLFHPWSDEYVGEYVGTGDGTTTNWNLPFKSGSAITVYVDGDEQSQTSSPAEATVTTNGGADNADLLELDSAPSSGARITVDFTGYLKVRSFFDADEMSFSNFYDRLLNTGLDIQGMLNT